MLLRAAIVAAALAAGFAPATAAAQFAGVLVAPPRRTRAEPLTAQQTRVQQDSARREAMSDMRAWVDSAAGVVTVTPRAPNAPGRDPASRPDSTRTPAAPPRRPPL